MAKTKVKLNLKGFNQVRQSSEMYALIRSEANQIKQRAGEGYKVNVAKNRTRAVAFVRTTDSKSIRDNLDNNTLLKAMR